MYVCVCGTIIYMCVGLYIHVCGVYLYIYIYIYIYEWNDIHVYGTSYVCGTLILCIGLFIHTYICMYVDCTLNILCSKCLSFEIFVFPP